MSVTDSQAAPPAPLSAAPDLATRLCTWAREVGFDRAGVASVQPIERGQAFLDWLERGDHAAMAYLEQRVEERLEPERILPGARAVLAVALRYHPLPPESDEPSEPLEAANSRPCLPGTRAVAGNDLWSGVARYAHGRDYHNLLGKRLKKLARRIRQEIPDCDTRAYVDTGPVLEREVAARAGLGVQGKNTCLLTRGGSWYVLGEIFLTAELGTNSTHCGVAAPLTDLCGRCTLCLEACPTGALPEPFRLDSRRCISYWTIEHRGAIPRDIRPQLGTWTFGCDICQEVCPWNRRPTEETAEADFLPDERRRDLDLVSLLALDPATYRRRFEGSPLQRARLEGLQRNAAITMGNRGRNDTEAAARYRQPLIETLEHHPEPLVRRHAAWALGELELGAPADGPVRRTLETRLLAERDPEVLAEIEAALEAGR